MYLGNGPPRRKKGSNPIRVLVLFVLIAIGLYLITVQPEAIPQPFQPTPTPTRTAVSHITEAEEYFQQGKLEEAIRTYELAIRADPTIVENYVPLVRLLVFQGRIDEGLEYAETALFVNPDYAPARAIRAMTLDWKSARLENQGLKEEADDLMIQALGEINRVIEQDPTLAEAYAFKAEILFDLGNYQEADEAINNALQLNPKSLDVQRVAGYLAEFRGYRDEAIQHYSEAIRIESNLPLLHLALGRTYIAAGEINLARDSLQKAIALNPTNSEYHYFMGYAYFVIGERELASDSFKQAIELRPNYPAAHCQLGLIYYQNRNWEGALPELEIGVEGYGDVVNYRNAFCFYVLGLSYYYLDRCEDAYPLFDKVLAVLPDNAPAEEGIRLCREAERAGPAADVTPTPSP
jgi:tetratricopeptide (TPR) repeat protein